MEKTKKLKAGSVTVPFKAGLWYTASSVITKGISLLTTPIFTRLMSEAEYAVYPLYLSRMGILSALGGIEALGTALLVGMQKSPDKRDGILRSAIALESLIIALFCILYFTFYGVSGNLSKADRPIMLMMFLQVIFDGGTVMVMLRWRYEYKYLPVFLTNVISSIASAVLSILITERLPVGGEGRVIALLAVSGIVFFILVSKYVPSGAKADKDTILYLMRRAVPLIPQGLGTALLAGADRIMILRYYGAEQLAKYSVAHSVGVAICFASTALLMALRPWTLRRLHSREIERVRETMDICVPILCVAVLAVVCISPELMRFLAPKSYSEAAFAILPTALSVVPAFLSSVTATALIYHGKSGRAVIPVIAGVASNIALNYVFFTKLPYTSAALSSLIAGCISLILWMLVYRAASKERLFSFGRCTMVFVAVLSGGLLLYSIRELLLLRMILFGIIIAAPLPLYIKAFKAVKEKPSAV